MIIESYESLLKWVNSNRNNYYFRCYSKENELISTLGRKRCNTANTYVDYEFDMFKEFAVQIIDLIPNVTLLKAIELGQHFSLPTRFIDFTIDPYVALFFGLGKCNNKSFHLCYTNNDNEKINIGLKESRDTLWDLGMYNMRSLYGLTLDQIGGTSAITLLSKPYVNSEKFHNSYQKLFANQQNYTLISYDPDEKINPRIMAQKGLFIAMKNPSETLSKDLFSEIDIKLTDKDVAKLREFLEKKDYTPRKLFPKKVNNFDVENLVKAITARYPI